MRERIVTTFHLGHQSRKRLSIRPIHCCQDCHCSASTHEVPAHGHCTIKCCLHSFPKCRHQPPLSLLGNEGTPALLMVVRPAARVCVGNCAAAVDVFVVLRSLRLGRRPERFGPIVVS